MLRRCTCCPRFHGILNLAQHRHVADSVIRRITAIQSSRGGNERHDNNMSIIFKRVWKSSRGINPSFRAHQYTRGSRGRVRELRYFLFSSWSDNIMALFPFHLMSGSSFYSFIHQSRRPAIQSPIAYVAFIHVKIASYLPIWPSLFPHTNLQSF